MTQIVVVYHSGYGHTERVAEFVDEGEDGDSNGEFPANGGVPHDDQSEERDESNLDPDGKTEESEAGHSPILGRRAPR